MEKNIADLLSEKELLSSQLEKMIYGSIEIRNTNGKEYIYVHKRIDGIKKSQYVGEMSNVLVNVITENNILAKQYKKRIKAINKELDTLAYNTVVLSDTVMINVALARRYMVDSIYKQAMLEGVATTYSDTETIVNGGKVNNMTATDVTKVVNLKRAWEFILNDGVISYPTNYAILCQINQIVEDGFSSVAGKLRTVPVSIGKSTYIPPMPIEFVVKEELDHLLHSNLSVIDKTIEIVLYVMKKQLFLDGNKRTAIIYANHYLISHGEGIIVVPAELVSEYKIHLIAYYEDRDTSSIKEFLKDKCWIKI
jgi:fido (protein-threonine AMPylation protein)